MDGLPRDPSMVLFVFLLLITVTFAYTFTFGFHFLSSAKNLNSAGDRVLHLLTASS